MCSVVQLCPTLCCPINCSLPDFSVFGDSPDKNTGVDCNALLLGILPTQRSNPGLPHCRQILYYLSHQASSRILEWVSYPFSRESSWIRNWTGFSCILYQLSYQGSSICKYYAYGYMHSTNFQVCMNTWNTQHWRAVSHYVSYANIVFIGSTTSNNRDTQPCPPTLRSTENKLPKI